MPGAGIEFVMLTIGRGTGIIGQEIFSAMVFMVIVSIPVSPPALKFVIQAERKKTKRHGVRMERRKKTSRIGTKIRGYV